MSERIDHLIACLNDKKAILESLVLLHDEERDLIENLDASGVEASSERKLRLMDRLEQSRLACKKALDEVAVELRLPGADRLSEVMDALSPPRRAMLAKAQHGIFELIEVLKRVNLFNRDLLFGSLKVINRSLEFYRGGFGLTATYSGSGRILSNAAGGRLVSGEI